VPLSELHELLRRHKAIVPERAGVLAGRSH